MRDRDRDDYDELSLEVQMLRDASASQAMRLDDERSNFHRQIGQLETQLERRRKNCRRHTARARAHSWRSSWPRITQSSANPRRQRMKACRPTVEMRRPLVMTQITGREDTTKRVAELETQV